MCKDNCLASYLCYPYVLNCNIDQITVKRTEQNSPFGLEVQMHVTEAVCPALSEPGN